MSTTAAITHWERFPNFTRMRDDVFVRIVTVSFAPGTIRRYVLKLSAVRHDREGQIYAALRGEVGIVPCPFVGKVTLTPATIVGIVVDDAAIAVPETLATSVRHRLRVDHASDIQAVLTRYDDRLGSLEINFRTKRDRPPPEFTVRVIRLLDRLFARHGFVHLDLHHHNILRHRRTGDCVLIDFDLSAVEQGDPSTPGRFGQILPLLAFASMCNHMIDARDASHTGNATWRSLGHMYDRVMVFNCHRMYATRDQDSSTQGGCTPPSAWNGEDRDIALEFQTYQNIRGILRSLGAWRTHLVAMARAWARTRRARLGDTDAWLTDMQHHIRNLLYASVLALVSRHGFTSGDVRRHLVPAYSPLQRNTTHESPHVTSQHRAKLVVTILVEPKDKHGLRSPRAKVEAFPCVPALFERDTGQLPHECLRRPHAIQGVRRHDHEMRGAPQFATDTTPAVRSLDPARIAPEDRRA